MIIDQLKVHLQMIWDNYFFLFVKVISLVRSFYAIYTLFWMNAEQFSFFSLHYLFLYNWELINCEESIWSWVFWIMSGTWVLESWTGSLVAQIQHQHASPFPEGREAMKQVGSSGSGAGAKDKHIAQCLAHSRYLIHVY